MVLWASLIALVTSSASIIAFEPAAAGGYGGLLELILAVSLFTTICANEARN